MIKIFQPNDIDCFRACVASILELPLSEVPSFVELHGRDYLIHALKFLEDRNYTLVCVPYECASHLFFLFPHIVVGRLYKTTDIHHATVYVGEEMVHDPMLNSPGYCEPPFERWLIVKVPQ
jgi:hypothetical protein